MALAGKAFNFQRSAFRPLPVAPSKLGVVSGAIHSNIQEDEGSQEMQAKEQYQSFSELLDAPLSDDQLHNITKTDTVSF